MAKKELVVGTAGDMPPLNMTTKEGQIIGVEGGLCLPVCQRHECPVHPETDTPSRPTAGAGGGTGSTWSCSGMTITTPRNLKVAFAGPYFASGKSVLGQGGQRRFYSTNSSKSTIPKKCLVAPQGIDQPALRRAVRSKSQTHADG